MIRNSVEISDERAHTGYHSLKVSRNSIFPQGRLRPKPQGKYVISCWVSRDDTDVHSFRSTTTSPVVTIGNSILLDNETPLVSAVRTLTALTAEAAEVIDSAVPVGDRVFIDAGDPLKLGIGVTPVGLGGTPIDVSQFFEPSGPVIDGWQRIEGTFHMPGNALGVNLILQNGGVEIEDAEPAYFDDLRFCPEDSDLETYVYDPHDYRLVATLNNNNFATLYHYDDQGSLHLVKEENFDGVHTVQEVRMHIRETEQD